MADTKITALAAIATVDPAADVLPIVDISDTSMAATGTTKKVTTNQILGSGGTATLASATITGDLTVDTSTLKVDSTNDRVGFGTASPAQFVHLSKSNTSTALTSPPVGGASLRIQNSSSTNNNFGSVEFYNAAGLFGASVNCQYTNQAAPTSDLVFVTRGSSGGLEHYRIAADGVATWSEVGGIAGTAMTLNATGLGIGASPASKLYVYGANVSGIGQFRIDCPAAGVAQQTFAINGVGQGNIYHDGAQFVIGSVTSTPLVFRTGSTVQATIDTSGNLLVGKTASSTSVAGAQVQPDGTLSAVKADANPGLFYNTTTAISGTVALFRSNGVTVGSISQDGTNTAYNLSSDYRLKEQVQPLVGGLARVNSLKPSIYKWKTNGSNGEGFLAHELAEVVPFAVTGQKDAMNEDGTINPQGVDLSKIVPILVAAIQELTAEVNALKNA